MDECVKDHINNHNGDESVERFDVADTDISLLTECENLTEIVGNDLVQSVTFK